LYELEKTSAVVRRRLDELGIAYTYPVAKTGIVATIGTVPFSSAEPSTGRHARVDRFGLDSRQGASPCVALRADMDALPIHEEVTCAFSSETPGQMHACGHDAHTAMLLSAGAMLKAREAELRGTVKLIFQPAEEGGAGGLTMVRAGVLDAAPKVERIFALHVWPALPSGVISTRSGTIMAAAGFYRAAMVGKGGHAAFPHTLVDPFMCAASALSAIQTIVSRNLGPLEAGVVSNTFMRGGTAYNVIPDAVELGGTMRSLSRAGYRYLDVRPRAHHPSASHEPTPCTKTTRQPPTHLRPAKRPPVSLPRAFALPDGHVAGAGAGLVSVP
jgi:IAA-amino acid hydrolase